MTSESDKRTRGRIGAQSSAQETAEDGSRFPAGDDDEMVLNAAREYLPAMGLTDDAEAILGLRATQEAAKAAEEQKQNTPYSADWSRELAAMLIEHQVPLTPAYVGGERPEVRRNSNEQWLGVQRCSYWGDVWALRGWHADPGEVPSRVEVLLDVFGAVTVTSLGRFLTLQRIAGGWRAATDANSWLLDYPDVSPEDRERFLHIQYAPRSANTMLRGVETLHQVVGATVAAALLTGTVPHGEWIEWLK